MMVEKSGKWTLGELINAASGLILAIITLLTFALLFPPSIGDLSRIGQLGTQITGIAGFRFTPSLIYTILVVSLIIALMSIFSIFYHNDNLSNSFQKAKTRKFFGFLMIYILAQLILTEIIAYLVPNFGNQFPFKESLGVQNFVFSFITLEETVLFQLVPIIVVLAVVGIMRGRLNIRAFTHYSGDWTETLILSFTIAAVSTFIISGTPLDYVSDFASLAILNIIFLRFGFLKAFLTNFAISMTNVTASLVAGNAILSQLLPLFLFFLGFLGVYSLVQVFVESQKVSTEKDVLAESETTRQRRTPQVEPFVYSRCPECGNAVYHVILPEMSLKCEKCEHVLSKDAVGEKNITIEMGRPNKY